MSQKASIISVNNGKFIAQLNTRQGMISTTPQESKGAALIEFAKLPEYQKAPKYITLQ